MEQEKAIPCTYKECDGLNETTGTSKNNVRYSIIRKGERLHCTPCRTLKLSCYVCKKYCPNAYEVNNARICIDCKKCPTCGVLKLDDICGNCDI